MPFFGGISYTCFPRTVTVTKVVKDEEVQTLPISERALKRILPATDDGSESQSTFDQNKSQPLLPKRPPYLSRGEQYSFATPTQDRHSNVSALMTTVFCGLILMLPMQGFGVFSFFQPTFIKLIAAFILGSSVTCHFQRDLMSKI